MAKAFADLRNETLRLLNESADSVMAELPSGTGSTATLSNDLGILDFLNEGACDLCRTCVYLPFQLTVPSHTGRTYDFSASRLVSPITITINGGSTPITHCGENELRSYNLSYMTTTGEPSYWYEAGYNNIGFYTVPTTAISFIATGTGITRIDNYK